MIEIATSMGFSDGLRIAASVPISVNCRFLTNSLIESCEYPRERNDLQ